MFEIFKTKNKNTKKSKNSKNNRRAIRRKEDGQAMVEFALLLPLFVLIIAIIIDFGWIFSCRNQLVNISGETARYVALHSSDDPSTSAQTYLNTRIANGGLTGTPSLVSASIDSNNIASVTLTEDAKYLTGIPGIVTRKNYITLKATGAMPVIG